MRSESILISEPIDHNDDGTVDWLRIVFIVFAIVLSVAIAFAVNKLGYLSLLIAPAAFVFLVAVGKPELGLAGFLVITYAQISDVAISYHGLPSIAQPLAGLLIVVILIRITIYGERPLGWIRASLFLLVYALSWLISLLHAENTILANDAFVGFAKDALGMLIVVYFIQSPSSLRRVIWVLLGAGIFLGTISVIQYLTGDFSNTYWGFGNWSQQVSDEIVRQRISGPYANPNAYAQVMVVLAPLALDRVWHEKNMWLRIIAAWAFTVVVLTVFFTYSRGGFLSLVFVVAVLLMMHRFNFVQVIVTALVGLGLIQFMPVTYVDRIYSLFELVPSGANQVQDSSFRGRISENTVAWLMFKDNPILGVGLGNYQTNYQDYSRNLGLDDRREMRSPASLYLELISEQGIVGVIIFASLMYYIFLGLVRASHLFVRSGLHDEAYIVAAILAGFSGYLFQAIFKNSAYSNVFWVLVGVALSAMQVATLRNVQLEKRESLSGMNL